MKFISTHLVYVFIFFNIALEGFINLLYELYFDLGVDEKEYIKPLMKLTLEEKILFLPVSCKPFKGKTIEKTKGFTIG